MREETLIVQKNKPKIKYDDKKYDVFFSHMISKTGLLDEDGAFKFEEKITDAGVARHPYLSFSIQLVDRRNKQDKKEDRLCTKFYKGNDLPFGFEFDINDRRFFIRHGWWCPMGYFTEYKRYVAKSEELQKDLKKDGKNYTKTSGNLPFYEYNKEKNENTGIDVRDAMVPKLINRLEYMQQTYGDKKLEKKEDENKYIDTSFEDGLDEYYEIKDFLSGKIKAIENMQLEFDNEKQLAGYYQYNEAVAYPKEKMCPNNMIVRFSSLSYFSKESNFNEIMIGFCKDHEKIFENGVRLIDEDKEETKMVSSEEYTRMLFNDEKKKKKMNDDTKKAVLKNLINKGQNMNFEEKKSFLQDLVKKGKITDEIGKELVELLDTVEKEKIDQSILTPRQKKLLNKKEVKVISLEEKEENTCKCCKGCDVF